MPARDSCIIRRSRTMSGAAVKSEQIRTLFRQSVPVLLANVIVGGIVCLTLWSSGPHARLLAWMCAMAAVTLARVELRRRYWRSRPVAADAAAWGTAFVVGSGLAGLLWGLACFLFFDGGTPMAQLLVTFAAGGMTAGAAGTLACYMPAFRTFVYPSLGLVVVRTIAIGGPNHVAMGVMLVVYGAAMAVAARNANRQISEAFRLRFENE